MKGTRKALLRRGAWVRHGVTDANGRVIRASTSSVGYDDYLVAVPHHSGGETVSVWSAANTIRA